MSDSAAVSPGDARWLLLASIAAICASAALFVVVSQASRFDHDEFEAAHAAWYVATGRTLYRDVFQNHHPLLYHASAPLVGANGWPTDLLNLRLALLPMVAVMAACTRAIAGLAGASRAAGWTAVFLLLTMTTFVRAAGEIRPDVPYACCAAVGFACAFRALRDGTARWLFASGVALAVGYLFHAKAIVPVAILALAVAWHWRREHPVRRLALFLAPPAVAFLAVVAWASWNGAFDDYWAMAWRFPAAVTGRTPQGVRRRVVASLLENTGVWVTAAVGALMVLRDRSATPARAWLARVAVVMVAALIGVGRPQYLLPVLPLLPVLGALALEAWARRRPHWPVRLVTGVVATTMVPLIVLAVRTRPAHAAQIEKMVFVRALVPPGASVYDGDILFNVYRDDVHYLWFLVGREPEMTAFNRLARPGLAPYDQCSLIRRRRPIVVSDFHLDLAACALDGQYRRVLPNVWVRAPQVRR